MLDKHITTSTPYLPHRPNCATFIHISRSFPHFNHVAIGRFQFISSKSDWFLIFMHVKILISGCHRELGSTYEVSFCLLSKLQWVFGSIFQHTFILRTILPVFYLILSLLCIHSIESDRRPIPIDSTVFVIASEKRTDLRIFNFTENSNIQEVVSS